MRSQLKKINLFYEEQPTRDRWFFADRYPRAIVRRVFRGRPKLGGQTRVFLNLCAGLDRLKLPYRVNEYDYAAKHVDEIVGIIGKPHVLNNAQWRNPILFGAAIYSHPSDDPNLLTRLAIRKILVPGPWMREMCTPAWGDRVCDWPVGINTYLWCPQLSNRKKIDVLIYDKVRWDRDTAERDLLTPIRIHLKSKGLSFATLRYGSYDEKEFLRLLSWSRFMVFICEHETQGIAYQQALSCNVPILAWDRGGLWQDPFYYPGVKFSPVSSVPYWDDRCGVKFKSSADFPERLADLFHKNARNELSPRDYVLENLTLEKCAEKYVSLYARAQDER